MRTRFLTRLEQKDQNLTLRSIAEECQRTIKNYQRIVKELRQDVKSIVEKNFFSDMSTENK